MINVGKRGFSPRTTSIITRKAIILEKEKSIKKNEKKEREEKREAETNL